MSGSTPEDNDENERPSPLEDLLVEEINAETKAEIAEAIYGLVGVTREQYLIEVGRGMDALDLQDRVVAYMLGRYARDILQHGNVTGSTSRMASDDLGAALGIHPADVDDAAMGNKDLRWYREGSQVELPFERVRHAAEMLSFSHGEEGDWTDEDVEQFREDVAEAADSAAGGGGGG